MANRTAPSPLALRVRELRKQEGLTAEALAALVPDPSMTKTVITNFESGRKRDLTVTELLQIASALNTPPLLLAATAPGPFEKVDAQGLAAPYSEMCLAEYLVANRQLQVGRHALSDGALLAATRFFETLLTVEETVRVHRGVDSTDYAPTTEDEAILLDEGAQALMLDRRDFSTEAWHDRIYDLRMDAGVVLREVRASSRRFPFKDWLRDRVNRMLADVEEILTLAGTITGPLPRVGGDRSTGYVIGTPTEEAARLLLLDRSKGADGQA